jgi:hypothetical protein
MRKPEMGFPAAHPGPTIVGSTKLFELDALNGCDLSPVPSGTEPMHRPPRAVSEAWIYTMILLCTGCIQVATELRHRHGLEEARPMVD